MEVLARFKRLLGWLVMGGIAAVLVHTVLKRVVTAVGKEQGGMVVGRCMVFLPVQVLRKQVGIRKVDIIHFRRIKVSINTNNQAHLRHLEVLLEAFFKACHLIIRSRFVFSPSASILTRIVSFSQ